MKTNEYLLALGSILIIAVSTLCVWKNYVAAPEVDEAVHQYIGEVLAEETIQALNHRGDILVITMADRDSAILAAQFEAFRARIKQTDELRIKDVVFIDSAKKNDYGPGRGLSASKLAREVKKHAEKAAIVSFVGLPRLEGEEVTALGVVPPLVTFSRDTEKLLPLVKRGMVTVAVVPRFTFPAPGPESPRTTAERFTNQYQVLRLARSAAE